MRSGSVALLLVTLVACTPSGSGRMIAVDPPEGWAERIRADRASRDGFFERDPESPLLAEDRDAFQGLDYYPLDPSLRFEGPIHFYPQPEPLTMITTTGQTRQAENVGWLSFVVEDQVCVLQVYRLLDSEPRPGVEALFLPFADITSGKQTYGAGRYLELALDRDGDYVLDFNRASNPWCAYGAPERFSCPRTPDANRLPVAIEAGERGFKRHEDDKRPAVG